MTNRRQKRESDAASETNWRVIVIALVAVITAGVLFWVSEHDSWFRGGRPLQATLNQVAGLIIATGLLSAVWELIGRRHFTKEVLAKAKLSADVTNSGITRITDQYLEDVEWADMFAGTLRLDIVVAYARTWRNTHWKRLEEVAATQGAAVRVFLPDPDDAETMRVLADRFAMSPTDIKSTVEEAVTDFSSLGGSSQRAVEVWVRAGDAVFSCYRFDARAVMTLYSHSRERRSSVPTFVVSGGQLFKFIRNEIDAVHGQSRRVYPEEEGQ